MELITLNREDLIRTLRDFGFTENECNVYIFVAKSGIVKAGEIASSLKIHKGQVYRILKNLQNKGIVESTLEFPSRFTAMPFEKVIDIIIKAKQEESIFLENKKKDILTYWKSINLQKTVSLPEKFVVIQGRSNIYARIIQFVESTKKEFLTLTTTLGLVRAYQAGIIDAVENNNIQTKFLTHVSNQNLDVTKEILRRISKSSQKIEGHHTNFASKIFPHFVIRDEEEGLFFLTAKEDSSIVSHDDIGLWTDNKVEPLKYAMKRDVASALSWLIFSPFKHSNCRKEDDDCDYSNYSEVNKGSIIVSVDHYIV